MVAQTVKVTAVEDVPQPQPEAPVVEAPPRPRGIRRVETSFFVGNDLYAKGTTVRIGHPLIEQFPDFFYPAGSVDVELED